MTGRSDASVWDFKLDLNKAIENRSNISFDNKLVWLGGIQDHKMGSMIWFIENVFPKVKEIIPNVEFHLWGMNTNKYDNPSQKIFGHGFYVGEDIPFKNSALFVNPDIIGGGVKLKLKNLFENGIPFITTPFGFEGYNKNSVDGRYCIVTEMDSWVETITNLLKNNDSINL